MNPFEAVLVRPDPYWWACKGRTKSHIYM